MTGKAKRELRSEMKRVIASLDKRWIKAASAEVCYFLSKLLNDELGGEFDHVLAWSSFFPGEIDLTAFISDQLDRRRVYLPRVGQDGAMTFISIDKNWTTSVESGYYGIPEPGASSGLPYNLDDAPDTVVIVPGLAFDDDGDRLGRGKGVYDGFLNKPQMADAKKLGVCWSLQLVREVPWENHDICMDWICHERGYFKAGAGPRKESDDESY